MESQDFGTEATPVETDAADESQAPEPVVEKAPAFVPVFDTSIPVPADLSTGGVRAKRPGRKQHFLWGMEIGFSTFVPEASVPFERLRSAIRLVEKRTAYDKCDTERKFALEPRVEGGVEGSRVWRVA